MPLKDVTVKIQIKKAARLTGLGKPALLAALTGPSSYSNYSEPEQIAEIFGEDSIAHKIATTLLKQGDSSPETMGIITYDPAATDDTPKTAAKALQQHFDEDFYFVVADTQAVADVKAIADVVEGEGIKMFATTITKLEDAESLQLYKYERTFAAYHETANEFPAEAWVGGHGSKEVGSITWMNKKLVGITPQAFSVAKLTDIENLNMQAFVAKSGHNVMSEGKTLSGEYIDVVHSKDWLIVNGANAIQEQLIANDKVAYTDKGIALLASSLDNVLIAGVAQDMISVTDNIPDYTITTLSRAQSNPADRAARIYKGLGFSFLLSGAIHRAEVKGEMII